MVEVREIKASEAQRWLAEGRAELIDIRDPGERSQMRIPEARWIPLTGLEAGLKAEPHQKIGIFHCRSGRRTLVHVDKLAAVGYPETYVLGRGHYGLEESGLSGCFRFRGPDRNHASGSDCGRQLGSTGCHSWEYGLILGFSDCLLSSERASCFPVPLALAQWP